MFFCMNHIYEEREESGAGSWSGSIPQTNGSGSGRPKNMKGERLPKYLVYESGLREVREFSTIPHASSPAFRTPVPRPGRWSLKIEQDIGGGGGRGRHTRDYVHIPLPRTGVLVTRTGVLVLRTGVPVPRTGARLRPLSPLITSSPAKKWNNCFETEPKTGLFGAEEELLTLLP